MGETRLNVKSVAERLGYSVTSVRRMIRTGLISNCTKDSKRGWVIPEKSLDAYLTSQGISGMELLSQAACELSVPESFIKHLLVSDTIGGKIIECDNESFSKYFIDTESYPLIKRLFEKTTINIPGDYSQSDGVVLRSGFNFGVVIPYIFALIFLILGVAFMLSY